MQYNGSGDSRRYLHADHQGSIIAQSDANGALLSALSYDAYGIPKTSHTDRFGYTGQVWLVELGLNYYKARMYSPKLGRFLQTDPIGYKDSMNMYAYVGNDPINKTDPSGMAQCGKSLTGANCETGLNDSDKARDNANSAAEGLKGVAGRMKEGKLTDADNAAIKVVGERFGKNFTTEKGLGKLAKGLEGAANKIGARGEGAVLRQGSTSTTTTKTAFVIPGGNSIYLNNYYFDGNFSDRQRERTMLHEGAHLDHKYGEDYIRNGNNERHGERGAFRNADTYAYPDTCGL